MKNIVESLNGQDKTRVLGIDPSSNAIAFTLVENGVPVAWGKYTFFRKADLNGKLFMIKPILDSILSYTGDPTLICIEQMISVQNPNTTRVLTYISGAIMYEMIRSGYEVVDCPPMTWKFAMGYKRVTKKLEAVVGRKEAQRLRKSQTQDTLKNAFPYFNTRDTDVADSCGIALWAAGNHLKGKGYDAPI